MGTGAAVSPFWSDEDLAEAVCGGLGGRSTNRCYFCNEKYGSFHGLQADRDGVFWPYCYGCVRKQASRRGIVSIDDAVDALRAHIYYDTGLAADALPPPVMHGALDAANKKARDANRTANQ